MQTFNQSAVLKDVPSSPHQIIKDPSQDHIRMSAYPNLEYGNLYNAIAMLLDVASNIQFGLNCKSKTLINVFGYLSKISLNIFFTFSLWEGRIAVFGLYSSIP